MKMGFDLDGVLYPWHYSIVRFFREFKGYEGTERAFWKYFTSLDKEEQDYYVLLPHLYTNTSPNLDAMQYLPKIAEVGEIYYITARDESLKSATLKFFDMYDLPFKENLIFSHDKANYVRWLGLDYFFDDLSKYLEAMKGITKAYLFVAPHNYEYRDSYSCVGSFKEIYEIITEQVPVPRMD